MKNELNLLAAALDASLAGGREILEVYAQSDLGVEHKEDNSPLTQADLRANKAIMQVLGGTGIPVLSEEGKQMDYAERSGWDLLWIVDPLDGTKEFIKRNGEFTVNIALVERGKPVLGVVHVPVKGQTYFGFSQGAYRFTGTEPPISAEGWSGSAEKLPITVQRPFTVVGSRSHNSPETEAYIATLRDKHGQVELVSMGSSLKLCLVAEGTADEYPRFAPTMEWDTAAGHAVCLAAGAEVFRYPEMEPLRYNRMDLLNPWFLVKKL